MGDIGRGVEMTFRKVLLTLGDWRDPRARGLDVDPNEQRQHSKRSATKAKESFVCRDVFLRALGLHKIHFAPLLTLP